eukprot:2707348-Rhodomonas_salina.1
MPGSKPFVLRPRFCPDVVFCSGHASFNSWSGAVRRRHEPPSIEGGSVEKPDILRTFQHRSDSKEGGHVPPSSEGGSLEHPDILRTFQHLSDSILQLAKQHAESAEKLASKLSDSV